MEVTDGLIALAREQQTISKNLIAKLFDKSSEGLNQTNNEIQDLRNRHKWYHSNIYQLHQLKEKITLIQIEYDKEINEILHEIRKKKEISKEVLHNALIQLGSTRDKNIERQYLDELIHQMDKLIDNTAILVLLGSIFGAFDLSGMITAMIVIFGGSTMAGVVTLGLGNLVGGAASELMFYNKLSDLNKKLINSITNVQSQKSQQLKQLDSYFDGFAQKLRQPRSANATIDIVGFN